MDHETKETIEKIDSRITKLINSKEEKIIKHDSYSFLSIGVEIVAGVLAGLIFGLLLDKLFASKPLFFIIGLVFGNIASGRTIWRKIKSR